MTANALITCDKQDNQPWAARHSWTSWRSNYLKKEAEYTQRINRLLKADLGSIEQPNIANSSLDLPEPSSQELTSEADDIKLLEKYFVDNNIGAQQRGNIRMYRNMVTQVTLNIKRYVYSAKYFQRPQKSGWKSAQRINGVYSTISIKTKSRLP